jgi:hypothetical protein
VFRLGPIKIDWPRSLGYLGGAALVVALDLIDPPLGLFIAAVPFLKMLGKTDSSRPVRVAGQVLDGVAKPVGGDSQGTLWVSSPAGTSEN